MAERFNLTAQINLQAPNAKDVANKIRKDLAGLTANVSIQADSKALAAVGGQLGTIDKQAKTASKSMGIFNRNLTEAARRFSVITVATGSFISLARAIKNSTGAAIEFERELVKISQVTGSSLKQLQGLSQEVTRLSTTLGVANASLLQTSRILAQAGLSAEKVRLALDVLARTTLAPSFDNIIDTTEGAIAILNQFGREAAKTGNDIVFLERSLDAINAVSKSFAVESADLISAIRRTGGVFQAAGGNINELIALFTSVRQTTRESAETIATGFRTIFTRLQRKDTIDALNELGISLQDAEGKFVGPLKAIEALSIGLAGLDPKDVRFNEIVEELGGFRQIGKVIPLINQYAVAQQALAVASNSTDSVFNDSEKAQQSLAVQFQRTRESFDALIRRFAQSDTFQDLAKSALSIANAFIKFAESLETVLPLLTSIAAIKIGRGLAPGILGLAGGQRRNSGGKILGFNRGGSVPGTGNRDTVPAMLTPGEFVIKKSSVQSIGVENLARMNENKFNDGGEQKKPTKPKLQTQAEPLNFNIPIPLGQISPQGSKEKGKATFTNKYNLGALRRSSGENFSPGFDDTQKINVTGEVSTLILQKNSGERAFSEDSVIKPIVNYGDSVISKQLAGVDKRLKTKSKLAGDKNAKDTLAGFAFESFASGITGVSAGGDQTPFDFVGVEAARLSRYSQDDPPPSYIDAKKTPDTNANILGKGIRTKEIAASAIPLGSGVANKKAMGGVIKALALGGAVQKFNTGGIVGQKAAGAAILDTVPSSTSSVRITGQEVKNQFSEFKGLAKGKDPVSKFYKSTNFAVTKAGLDENTSKKFKIALEDGLVSGINFATSQLSNDLGTPSARIDKSQTSNFVKSINTSIFGRLYENTVDAIARQGDFSKPDTDIGRPFDAEAGLPASLRDNFPDLPPKYIDLKASSAAASDSNLKGKVLSQIKRDLISQGILEVDYPGKNKKERQQQKRTGQQSAASSSGFPVKRATGGGISGQDTVPALLTPGEFVFSKSAAQSIGYGKLNQMNTKGAKGFNKGGVVPGGSVQRFADGGSVGGAGGVRGLKKFGDQLSSAGNALNGLSTAAIGFTFVAGTLVESSSELNEEQKRVAQAGLNAAASTVAFNAQLGSLAVETASQISQTIATKVALKELGQTAQQTSSALAGSGAGGLEGGSGRRKRRGVPTGFGNQTKKRGRIGSAIAGFGDSVGQFASEQKQRVTKSRTFRKARLGARSASGKVAGGLDKLGGSAGVAGAALGAFAVATIFQAKAAKETAESLEKLDIALEKSRKTAEEELEKIGTAAGGEQASEAKFVAAQAESVGIEQEKLAVSKLGDDKKSAATTGAIVGGLAGLAVATTKAGVALQAIPGVGTAVGAGLLAAAGAALAISYLFKKAETEYEKAESKREKAIATAISLSNDFSITQFRAAKASANLSTALQKAADAGLNTAGQINNLAAAFDQGKATFEAGEARLGGTTERKKELEGQLIEAGLLRETETGKIVEDEKGKRGATTEEKDQLALLSELREQEQQAIQQQQKLIQGLTAQANVFKNLANKAVGESINELTKIGPSALAAITSIDDLRARFPETAVAIDKANQKFAEAKDLEFAPLIKAAEDAAKAIKGNSAAAKQARKAQRDLAQALRQRLAAEKAVAEASAKVVQQEAIVAQQKLAVAALTAEQAERAKALTLLKTNKYLGAFNTFLLQSAGTLSAFNAIDDFSGRTAGSGATFEAIKIDTSVFDLPFEQLNDEAVKSITQLGKGVLSGSKEAERDADQFANNIQGVKNITSALPQIFNDFSRETAAGGSGNLPDIKKELVNSILASAGGNVGADIEAIVRQRVEEAVGFEKTTGKISFEDQQKLADELKASIEQQVAVFKAGVEVQNQFLEKLNKINNAIIEAKQREIDANTRVAETIVKNNQRQRELFGKPALSQRAKRDERNLKEAERNQVAQTRLAGTNVVAGDVNSAFSEFVRLEEKSRTDRVSAREEGRKQTAGGGAKGISATTKNITELNKSAGEAAKGAARAKAELERLADQSARAADIEADLNNLRGQQAQIISLQENIAFGSDEQRVQIGRDLQAASDAVNAGNIAGADEDQRASISRGLDLISEQVINFEGEERTGKEVKQILAARELGTLQGGDDINQFLDKLRAAEDPLQAELVQLGKEERAAREALAKIAQLELNALINIEKNTRTAFEKDLDKAVSKAGKGTPQEQALEKDQQQGESDLKLLNQALAASTQELENLRAAAENAQKALTAAFDAENAAKANVQSTVGAATGGYVGSKVLYRQDGGSIFKPKGTDTVPAMLTPGEFVVKKSSVDKIGVGNLTALNEGNASVVYRQEGGSVPAMLTPGEFVMSPKTVKKHGVGYMRDLNRNGTVPGFRRGGLVGRGLRSRSRGSGVLSIDPTALQQVLSDFNVNFQFSIDNMVASLVAASSSMDRLSNAITSGMIVTHQFSGDMTLAFNIQNGDVLKNQIAEAISPKISQMVSEAIDAKLNPNDFKSG